jgi:hypothetical protein
MIQVQRILRTAMGVGVVSLAVVASAAGADAKKTWSVKADYIEACSCNLFCQCYFAAHPEGGEFCEFNNAVMIREGHVGDVKVDGLKFWVSGDLGGDFTKGMKGAVITFDTNETQAQKDAIAFLVSKIYPVKFDSIKTDVAPITWEMRGNDGYAKLGDKGEVKLTGVTGSDGKLVVINNLKYWGADRNEGFKLAKSTHFYKANGYDYSSTDKNGFFITIEASGDMS